MDKIAQLKQKIGTNWRTSGFLFSGKKESPMADYTILDVQSATGVDPYNGAETPLVMFKLKNPDMPKSRWTLPCMIDCFFDDNGFITF